MKNLKTKGAVLLVIILLNSCVSLFEYESLQKEHESFRKTYESLRKNFESLRKHRESLLKENDELKTEIDVHFSVNLNLGRKHRTLIEENSSLQREIARLTFAESGSEFWGVSGDYTPRIYLTNDIHSNYPFEGWSYVLNSLYPPMRIENVKDDIYLMYDEKGFLKETFIKNDMNAYEFKWQGMYPAKIFIYPNTIYLLLLSERGTIMEVVIYEKESESNTED